MAIFWLFDFPLILMKSSKKVTEVGQLQPPAETGRRSCKNRSGYSDLHFEKIVIRNGG